MNDDLKTLSNTDLRRTYIAAMLQAQNAVMWAGIEAQHDQPSPEIRKLTIEQLQWSREYLAAVCAEIARREER